MKNIKIPEITIDLFEAFGDEELEKVFDMQEKAVNDAWKSVYSNISRKLHILAYWDEKPMEHLGYKSFMRYALHHSPKRDGYLQMSVMETRNGRAIPTSDQQFSRIDDFLRRSLSFGSVNVNFITL